MTDYFQEMGWRELEEGERPDHFLHLARLLMEYDIFQSDSNVQWPRLAPPASVEVVKNLPEVVMKADDKDCPICLKNFEENEKAKKMPCSHIFHSTCILTWLKQTNSCPFCRHELPTDDESYEIFKQQKKRAEQRKEDLEVLHNSMFS